MACPIPKFVASFRENIELVSQLTVSISFLVWGPVWTELPQLGLSKTWVAGNLIRLIMLIRINSDYPYPCNLRVYSIFRHSQISYQVGDLSRHLIIFRAEKSSPWFGMNWLHAIFLNIHIFSYCCIHMILHMILHMNIITYDTTYK